MDPGVTAQSLYAPLIFTAGYQPTAHYPVLEEALKSADAEDAAKTFDLLPKAVSRLAADTLLIRGDLQLKAGSRVDSNLVVQGTLRSGPDCAFLGDVKAGRVQLGPRNQVARNLVSGSTLELGDSSFVGKAVVAETDIVLSLGARVGQPGKLAVVTAGRDVRMERDVAVWGKAAAGRAVITL